MSTSPAVFAANAANAQLSTGAQTPEGHASSSKNAITHGLFTKSDFIRPGEENDYAQAKADLETTLAPIGPLESGLVTEIHRALWRLRRCGEAEGSFVMTDSGSDPMRHESTAKLQFSVDRARTQTHRLLHKCTAELRRLQTERYFLNETFVAGFDLSEFGLCDYRAVQKSLAAEVSARLRKRHLDEAEQCDEKCNVTQAQVEALLKQQAPSQSGSFCKTENTPPQTPRNAPCPCNSGEKYKRCCGKNAPPLLQAA